MKPHPAGEAINTAVAIILVNQDRLPYEVSMALLGAIARITKSLHSRAAR